MIGVHKDEKKLGQIHNHGTTFTINEKQIELLYEKYNFSVAAF